MQSGLLSTLLEAQADGRIQLERSSLKAQAVDLLRAHIAEGRIPPGTKIVEREVAELLGISRAPARDALLELEKEGLIVSKSHGRHVIRLTERDIRELYQVRAALEQVAVELATWKSTPTHQRALLAHLESMRQAVASRDTRAFTRSDIDTHTLIWQQADNIHLLRSLNHILGPIFMFVATSAEYFDWQETLELHADLVMAINSGDVEVARLSMARHMDNSLQQALKAFQLGQQRV